VSWCNLELYVYSFHSLNIFIHELPHILCVPHLILGVSLSTHEYMTFSGQRAQQFKLLPINWHYLTRKRNEKQKFNVK
jgi:hypothetical protein